MESSIGELFIIIVVVTMCFVGLFGNISLLLAVFTKKELQHKICYIVAVLACLHIVCLLCELYIDVRRLRFHSLTRSECFRHTFIYLFAIMAQSGMFFMVVLDILFAVIIPLRHLMFNPLTYVFYMCLPPFVFAFVIVLYCFLFMNKDLIEFCAPIKAFPHNMAITSYVINGLNIATLILLFFVFAAIRSSQRSTINVV